MEKNENFLDPVYEFFNKRVEEARDMYRKENSFFRGEKNPARRMTQLNKTDKK